MTVEKVQNSFPQLLHEWSMWKNSFPQWKTFPHEKESYLKTLCGFPTYPLALLLLLPFLSQQE